MMYNTYPTDSFTEEAPKFGKAWAMLLRDIELGEVLVHEADGPEQQRSAELASDLWQIMLNEIIEADRAFSPEEMYEILESSQPPIVEVHAGGERPWFTPDLRARAAERMRRIKEQVAPNGLISELKIEALIGDLAIKASWEIHVMTLMDVCTTWSEAEVIRDPKLALLRFLYDAYTPHELRRSLHHCFGTQWERAALDLPSPDHIAVATWIDHVLTCLDRHGLLNETLLQKLRKDRPARVEEINDIAALFSTTR